MGALIIFLIVLAAIAVLALVFVVGQYNALVVLRNRFKNAFSQIDVQLKRRYDLIPNLVETAKGYLKHESSTLEAVIQARNAAQSAGGRAAANPGDPQAMRELGGAERHHRRQHRGHAARFGKKAIELGYLKPHQVDALLKYQRSLQTRLGHYFIEKGLLTEEEADQISTNLKNHNNQLKRRTRNRANSRL